MIKYEVEKWYNGDNFKGGNVYSTYKEAKKEYDKIIKEVENNIKDLREHIKEYGVDFDFDWDIFDFIQINKFENDEVDMIESHEFNTQDIKDFYKNL